LVALDLLNSIYFPKPWHWLSADLVALLRRLGGAFPFPLRRLGGALPQTWWRFSADLVALYIIVQNIQNITEHSLRTFLRIQNRGFSKKPEKKATLKSQRTTTFKGRSGDGRYHELYG
jgi:hypothetical protein